MTTVTKHHRLLSVVITAAVCSFITTTTASASVIVTQIQERCHFSLWLLSQHIQQDIAHNLIIDMHEIIVVPEFTAESMAGADIVYVSPAYDELNITLPEMEAIKQFVIDGGRLILPGDYGPMWIAELGPIADHMEVIYGNSVFNIQILATITNQDNPITNGPHGLINTIQGAAVNNSLNSHLDDFEVLATWAGGSTSIGFLKLGAGEAVFLTDFSTFDSDMINGFDNREFWLNLFEYKASNCPLDLDKDDTVGTSDLLILLGAWGSTPKGPPDFDGDGIVGTSDLLILLADWGPC